MFAQACGSHTGRVFPTIALSRYVWRLAGSGCYLALFSVLAVLSGGVCRGDNGFTLWTSVCFDPNES